MSALTLGLLLGALVAALVLAAYEWARLCVTAYRFLESRLGHPGPAPDTQPIAAAERVSQGPQGRPPEGVDGPRSGGYVEPPAVSFARRDYHLLALVAVPLGTAEQPDFESFFGGFQTAIEGVGIVVLAVGLVVMARKYLRP